jgi:hypothetical protein
LILGIGELRNKFLKFKVVINQPMRPFEWQYDMYQWNTCDFDFLKSTVCKLSSNKDKAPNVQKNQTGLILGIGELRNKFLKFNVITPKPMLGLAMCFFGFS